MMIYDDFIILYIYIFDITLTSAVGIIDGGDFKLNPDPLLPGHSTSPGSGSHGSYV